MHHLPPPPIIDHPREVSVRKQEAPDIRDDDCGDVGEDIFEAEVVMIFGDGIRHLYQYHLV